MGLARRSTTSRRWASPLILIAITLAFPAAAEARYKAFMDTSTPTTVATFVTSGSTPNAHDALVLRPAGPRMSHDRFDKKDSQFASDLDFDTTRPGNQYLPTASTSKIVVNAGGGDDLIRLGAPPIGAGAQNFRGQLVVNGGPAPGYDMLYIDAIGDGNRNVSITESFMESHAGTITGYSASISRSSIERLTLETGGGNDNVVIPDLNSTSLSLITGAGNDRVAFTGPFGPNFRGGFISMGDGTDQLDLNGAYSAPDLTKWRYFDARFGPLGSPLSPALGYGSVRVDPDHQDGFHTDVVLTDLIGGSITSSSINSGDPLSPGPVSSDLGANAWLPTLGGHRSLLIFKADYDADPALDTSIASLSNPPGRHFRVNTQGYPNGEVGGKILDPNTTAGEIPEGRSFNRFVAGIEQVFDAAVTPTARTATTRGTAGGGESRLNPFAFTRKDGRVVIDTAGTVTCHGPSKCRASATARWGTARLGSTNVWMQPRESRKMLIKLSRKQSRVLRNRQSSTVTVRVAVQRHGRDTQARRKTLTLPLSNLGPVQ